MLNSDNTIKFNTGKESLYASSSITGPGQLPPHKKKAFGEIMRKGEKQPSGGTAISSKKGSGKKFSKNDDDQVAFGDESTATTELTPELAAELAADASSESEASDPTNPGQTKVTAQSEPQAKISLFDLGREKIAAATPAETPQVNEDTPKASPFNLFTHGAAKEKIVKTAQAPDEGNLTTTVSEKRRLQENEETYGGIGFHGRTNAQTPAADEELPKANLTMGLTGSSKKGNSSQFAQAQEQPDLSYVNPLAMNTPANPMTPVEDVKKSEKPASIAPRIQEIIDQIVDKIYTVKVEGQTDTTIMLKYPPMFAGANLVISAFDTARGEFNVSFENLTPKAKQLLDMQETQHSMKLALEEKGYAVHIITATTNIENSAPIGLDEGRFSRDQGDENEGRQEGRRENPEEQET